MITLGIDIGSLTAKAVVLQDGRMAWSRVMKVRPTARQSAEEIFSGIMGDAGLLPQNIDCCCSTGYGRSDIPFADMDMSEISCHAMGAFRADSSVRSVIDIGGQDCKVISLDGNGKVSNFSMNEKCAAGTGRSLEILAESIGLTLEELGALSLKSRRRLEISNKCSIFMELDVMHHLYNRKKKKDIARAINSAVAKRVLSLAGAVDLDENICITGGVSKNRGVVAALEKMLNIKFTPLPFDPQLMGAAGAAVFAMMETGSDEGKCIL